MVAKPILELTSVSSLTGNEQFPVVQYGATKKASINDIAVPLSHFFPAIGVAITGVNSVETGGSLVSGVTIDLVNDTASPGALMLYGTDLAGTRGWQPQTAGGTVAVVDSGAGLTGGPITVSGSLSVATNGIADTMLRQSAALSVMGRSANSTGNVADIAATTSGHVLQVVGNALAFAPVTASGIGAVASVSGTANEITAIGVDVVTIGLSNTLYFGGKTVSGGTFYNMVVNNITVSGGTEQGVTYSGGTIWNAVVNSPTVSGGTWQGGTLSGPVLNNPTINNVTVSGSTFNNSTLNNPTVSGGNFSAPRLSNAVAGGNWTTSGTWALPAITLSGGVTATGQTITNGTFQGPTFISGALGTPISGNLLNCTNLPLTSGVSGILPSANGGTGVAFFSVSSNLSVVRSFVFPNSSATIAAIDQVQTYTRAQRGAVVTLTASGVAFTPNFNLGNNFRATISGVMTLNNPTNVVEGQSGFFHLICNAGATTSLSYGNVYVTAAGAKPAISVSSGAVNIMSYAVYNSTSVVLSNIADIKVIA